MYMTRKTVRAFRHIENRWVRRTNRKLKVTSSELAPCGGRSMTIIRKPGKIETLAAHEQWAESEARTQAIHLVDR